MLPGLLQPVEPGGDHADLPALGRLLSRAEVANADARSFEQLVLDWFNVNLPACTTCAAILGAHREVPDLARAGEQSSLLFRADPVYQQIDMHSVLLGDPILLDLSIDEAQALVDALNKHLAVDALQLTAGAAQRWYLHGNRGLEIQTTSLTAAIGHNIGTTRASGVDAGYWQRLLTECQMILFDHPVNLEREKRGQLPVNSLWLWGEGSMPDLIGSPVDRQVIGDDFYTRSLAQFTQATWHDRLPDDLISSGASLVVERRLQTAVNTGDAALRQRVLGELETSLFAPLWKRLAATGIAELDLWTGTHWWRLDYRARRRFWIRPRPFDRFLEPVNDR